jgi:IS30 family transposase
MVADLSIALIKRMSTPGTIALRKQCLPALHPRLLEIVASKLILDWSPEQICGPED